MLWLLLVKEVDSIFSVLSAHIGLARYSIVLWFIQFCLVLGLKSLAQVSSRVSIIAILMSATIWELDSDSWLTVGHCAIKAHLILLLLLLFLSQLSPNLGDNLLLELDLIALVQPSLALIH